MKKIKIIMLLCIITVAAHAQKASVEKSIYGVQIGTVGLWAQNETKLTNKTALRTEVGVYTEIQAGIGYFIAPEIIVEPRWYYNLENRVKKGKSIEGNSGNFIGLKTNYKSDIFEISNYNLDRAEKSFLLIPKWGIRRKIGNSFNYEAGFGLGIQYFEKSNINIKRDEPVADLHLRIGYTF